MADKRKTGTLPRHIQEVVKNARQVAAAQTLVQTPIGDPLEIIKSLTLEQLQLLDRMVKEEIQLRTLPMPPKPVDLTVALGEWKRRNGL